MRKYLYLLLFGLMSLGFNLKAQDPIKLHPVTYTTDYLLTRNLGFKYTDTAQNEVEIFNPLQKNIILYQDLGNIGSASRSAVYRNHLFDGFGVISNSFSPYQINGDATPYFTTHLPVTDLMYVQAKKEQLMLALKHAQNILPRWSIGIDFKRLTSEGFYIRQKTSHYNFQAYTRFFSKNKRYELIAYALWNRGYAYENGGITSDSAFEALTGQNKNVEVNLYNSENRFKHRTGFIKQFYRFGQSNTIFQEKDTAYHFQTKTQLSYTLKAEEYNHVFINNGDSINALMPNEYYSTTPGFTYDSMYNGILNNHVALQLFNSERTTHKQFFSVGLKHQLIRTGQPTYIRNMQNWIADLQFERETELNKKLSFWVNATYCLSGFNASNYLLKASVRYRLNQVDLSIGALSQAALPEYNYLKFSTNQFIWENHFKAVESNSLFAKLTTNGKKNPLDLEFRYTQINHFVYANTQMLPEQSKTKAVILQGFLSKTLQAGKFYFTHKLIYQHSNANVIPVPTFGGMIRYYFQTRLFTSKLQLGVDVFYNTQWYGQSWNPASRLFFIQQQTAIGNYPVIAPFASLQIKGLVFFARLEHSNQNLKNEGFYYTPHYPITLQNFGFGVRWRMYN